MVISSIPRLGLHLFRRGFVSLSMMGLPSATPPVKLLTNKLLAPLDESVSSHQLPQTPLQRFSNPRIFATDRSTDARRFRNIDSRAEEDETRRRLTLATKLPLVLI